MIEVMRHEAGVLDADTEAEGAHRRGLCVLDNLLDDQAGPRVRAGVGVAERVDVVAASPTPRDLAQVQAVVNPEVEKGGEVLLVDGLPKPKLRRDAIVEPVQDRQAVASFRCGGQAEQFDGLQVIENSVVRGCGRVVKLVDDDDIEVFRG